MVRSGEVCEHNGDHDDNFENIEFHDYDDNDNGGDDNDNDNVTMMRLF